MSIPSGVLASNLDVFRSNMSEQRSDGAALQLHGCDTATRSIDSDPNARLAMPENEIEMGTKNGGGSGSREDDDDGPSVDIFINNVVCMFSVRCHLNLRKIGQSGSNVEYRREHGKVNMRFRNPRATATIWSSGKITITGNDSEVAAKKTARKCARSLQKMGFNVRFSRYKVVNVLGTCSLPFSIKISEFSEKHPKTASYEPELHPAVTYKLHDPRATLKIFSTGSITVTAPAVENINLAIQHIYPLVEPFKRPLSEATKEKRLSRKRKYEASHRRRKVDDDEDDINVAVVADDDEEFTDEEFANEGAEDEDSEDYSSDDSI